jgi:hypothetical protein
VAGYHLGQRWPGDVCGGQPRQRAIDVRVYHRGGEQAAHPPRRGDLQREARPELRIRGQFGADDFHGDRPPARRHAEEDLPHAPLAKPPGQAIRSDYSQIPRLQFPDHA